MRPGPRDGRFVFLGGSSENVSGSARSESKSWEILPAILPGLVNIQKTIENSHRNHRNSGFSH